MTMILALIITTDSDTRDIGKNSMKKNGIVENVWI